MSHPNCYLSSRSQISSATPSGHQSYYASEDLNESDNLYSTDKVQDNNYIFRNFTPRTKQTARKTTGGRAPKRQPQSSSNRSLPPLSEMSSPSLEALEPFRNQPLSSGGEDQTPSTSKPRDNQTARKSTGSRPPRPKPAVTHTASAPPPNVSTPSSWNAEPPSNQPKRPRLTQTARKSTGGAPPRRKTSHG
ncbi:hypothetical protein HETIRDRAFT_318391 [Heterobasidion irregulare TC 32-1]|uniref:Uncharacterized protein n=1 Tax=Heterobasidion irregulare (strain TC 32-1) TaxID=747525 RepID=W4K7R5_HETIT|nr:uncharacterized protein HETIRDRAFT_318391 [Heterobasidion irregulare TC 32-1]ETW81395.1 hypothetical protein HETIRDRAFT_318391 [Heterobasidion irregulare TC 32-1]